MNHLERDQKDVQKLLDISEGLTDWELEFVEGVGRWVFDKKLGLTYGQRLKLNSILEDHDL